MIQNDANTELVEEYKDIQGYENYLISNLGNIKNKKTNKILSTYKNHNNYVYVSLYKNGKSNKIRVHRLVGKAFIQNPDNKPEIDHIDKKRDNNIFTNLRWATHSENMQHAYNKLN